MPEPIPQPVPLTPQAPPPQVPPAPRNSDLMLVRFSGFDELGVVAKRSYRWRTGEEPRRDAADAPLRELPADWPEPVEGRGPAPRQFADAHAWRLGTDLLVRGTARSARPVQRLELAIVAEGRTTAGVAWGTRRLQRSGSAWIFSQPEPFSELVLRPEFAYGGRDLATEESIIAKALADMGPEKARRAGPSVGGILRGGQPLAYPRNPVGLGYVLEDREHLAGRELPRLECADDLLDQARLILPAPFGWQRQPLPLLWAGMALHWFPRIAMAGAPPPGYQAGDPCAETERGLLPAGFCHGNVHATESKDLPGLIDPLVTGNADLPLRFPRLTAGSPIRLRGFDAAGSELVTAVPRDVPLAVLPDPSGGGEARLRMQLSEVVIDADAGTMDAVFTARLRVGKPPTPTQLAELFARLRILDGAR